MPHSNYFKQTILSSLISLFCFNSAQASLVRNDIDYQYFRDLAENKGQFTVGATNIPIYNYKGYAVGTMLQNIPMPDLSSANRDVAIATLNKPQYLSGVKHNSGFSSVQFGSSGVGTHPDAHHFYYLVVDRNNHPTYDYHSPRLHKLVTETTPVVAGDDTTNYSDKERFPAFIRLGSGNQGLRNPDNTFALRLAGPYAVLSGGTPLKIIGSNKQHIIAESTISDTSYGPMASYAIAGDSGSPLYAYDAQNKRWIMAGALSSFIGDWGSKNYYSISHSDFINQSEQDDTITLNNSQINSTLSWKVTSNSSSEIRFGNQSVTLNLLDPAQKSKDSNQVRPSLNNGQTLNLSSENATLVLQDDINQGAGALYFNSNVTVKPLAQQQWTGAGISVAKNKQVNWQVSNPQGDRLSKIGEGTLYVNGVGANQGSISVGEGTVILAQRADAQKQQQAFSEVGIVSGRSTVVLNDANQVDPNNIYFGFRGGRLDLNGNKLDFYRIQNVDEGANIVNHNANQKAQITITAGNRATATQEDIEWVNWYNYPKTDLALYEYRNNYQGGRTDYFVLKENGNPRTYFPINASSNSMWEFLGSNKETAINTLLSRVNDQRKQQNVEWLSWAESPKTKFAIYEYTNTHHNNRKDYFILKGSPTAYFPTEANSDSNWQFVGHNKEEAINRALALKYNLNNTAFNGYFGETDKSKVNGELDVIYNTPNEMMNLISGGTELNGKLKAINGQLVLSGRPVLYAKNLSKKEIIKDDKWIDRTFRANEFQVRNNASLYVGRNVSEISGNFTATDNAKIQIGLIDGQTPVCVRSDYTGIMSCNTPTLDENIRSTIPVTQINGNVTLTHNAQWILGKSNWYGSINASNQTSVTLNNQSQWTMMGSSTLGNLVVNDAQITLNKDYATSTNGLTTFNTLTINGNLTGNARFNYLTNLARSQGDNIVVNGLATGKFELAVKNTGAEPNNVNSTSLIRFTHPQQTNQANVSLVNNYVDLGAYRYILKKHNQDYHLYSPVRDIQLNAPRYDEKEYQQALNVAKRKEAEANAMAQDITGKQQQVNEATQSLKELDKDLLNAKSKENKARIEYNKYGSRLLKRRFVLEQLKRAERNTNIAQLAHTVAQQDFNKKYQNLQSAMALLENARKSAQEATIYAESLKNRQLTTEEIKVQAKNLCQQANYNANVCSEVVQKASAGELEMALAEFDRASDLVDEADQLVEQTQLEYQNALQAVKLAQNSANPQDIDKAKQNADRQYSLLQQVKDKAQKAREQEAVAFITVRELENKGSTVQTHQEIGSVFQQKDWASQYSNTALSELSAQTNAVLHLAQNLDRHLLSLSNHNGTSVWGNIAHRQAKNHSNLYRSYKQNDTLTQIGSESVLGQNLKAGVVFSHSFSQNDYDDNYSSKSKLTGLSLYLKQTLTNGIFGSIDASYWRSNNQLQQDKVKFHRHIKSVGINLGKIWNVVGFTFQPSVSGRYTHLSAVNYGLGQANINTESVNLISYSAGLQVAKTFELGNVIFTPAIDSYMVDARHHKLSNRVTVNVNNQHFEQQFGRSFNHEVSLNSRLHNWEITARLGFSHGNETGTQKFTGLKASYRW